MIIPICESKLANQKRGGLLSVGISINTCNTVGVDTCFLIVEGVFWPCEYRP